MGWLTKKTSFYSDYLNNSFAPTEKFVYDENGNLCKYDINGNQIWYNPNTDSWQNWNLTDPFDDKNYDKDGNWQGDYKLASLLEDGSFYASVFPDPVGILKGSGNYFKSVYKGFKTFIGIAGLLGEKRQNEINDNILIVSTIMIGAGKLSKITKEYKGVIEYLVKNHFDEIAAFTKNMITKNSAELVGTIGTTVGINQLVKNVGVKGPGVALSTLDLRMWGNAIHIADQIRPYIPSSVMDAIRDGSLFKQ